MCAEMKSRGGSGVNAFEKKRELARPVTLEQLPDRADDGHSKVAQIAPPPISWGEKRGTKETK